MSFLNTFNALLTGHGLTLAPAFRSCVTIRSTDDIAERKYSESYKRYEVSFQWYIHLDRFTVIFHRGIITGDMGLREIAGQQCV